MSHFQPFKISTKHRISLAIKLETNGTISLDYNESILYHKNCGNDLLQCSPPFSITPPPFWTLFFLLQEGALSILTTATLLPVAAVVCICWAIFTAERAALPSRHEAALARMHEVKESIDKRREVFSKMTICSFWTAGPRRRPVSVK